MRINLELTHDDMAVLRVLRRKASEATGKFPRGSYRNDQGRKELALVQYLLTGLRPGDAVPLELG